MYISPRTALFRNVSLAVANGTITLVILLIAPLGLAAVIINTILITVATYAVGTTSDRAKRFRSSGDRIIKWLSSTSQQAELFSLSGKQSLRRPDFRN
ncbi:MAG: hypothetical protein H0X31_23195 [Nostocaceae cyanobacterium]|nr:hypothetical protein [Nostocaceae cyanobacterium]